MPVRELSPAGAELAAAATPGGKSADAALPFLSHDNFVPLEEVAAVHRRVERLHRRLARRHVAALRAGLVATAAMAGVSERAIMQQTGHNNTAMLRRYIHEGSLFRENGCSGWPLAIAS